MDMPDFFPEELKKLLNQDQAIGVPANDYENWVQVATLDGEDILRRKMHNKKADVMQRKLRMLNNQIKLIHAEADVLSAKWWDSLHVKYSIPMKGNFHITQDNRILMEPTKGKGQ